MSGATRLMDALHPLGFVQEGLSGAELTAVGEELDLLARELELIAREMCPVTAEDWGLTRTEEYLQRTPNAPTLERRRASLIALLQAGGGSATVAGINETLSGCGLVARARETGAPGQVEVYFPEVPGVPDGFPGMKRIIESILPCHLEVIYYFWKIEWDRMEQMFATWDAVEAMGFDFETLEKYVV